MKQETTPSPSIPVKDEHHHPDCPAIDGFGCRCDELSPLPVKDELLHVDKGNLQVSKFDNGMFDMDAGDKAIAQIKLCGVGEEKDLKAICTAVNNTYGKGYNPAAMEELYKQLEKLSKRMAVACAVTTDEYNEIVTSLQNAKLNP